MTTPIPATPMDVVIFGLGLASELAAFLLIHDSPYRPVGFTVHERFVSTPELNGLPVQRFEDMERVYPPERYALLAPLAWRRMGDLRADVVSEGRARGVPLRHVRFQSLADLAGLQRGRKHHGVRWSRRAAVCAHR